MSILIEWHPRHPRRGERMMFIQMNSVQDAHVVLDSQGKEQTHLPVYNVYQAHTKMSLALEIV